MRNERRNGPRTAMAAAALLLCAGACADDPPPPRAPGGGPVPSTGSSVGGGSSRDGGRDSSADGPTPPAVDCPMLDLLFGVDNSTTMAEEQALLALHVDPMLRLLEGQDPPVDYRVGVAHTAWENPALYSLISPGLEGAMLQTLDMAQPWLDADDPSLDATLGALLNAGALAEVDEDAPLRVALSAVGGANRGFLREGAMLGIVVVTDVDDTSLDGGAEAREELAMAFDDVMGDRDSWSLNVVAGGRSPVCLSELGEATYAEQLRGFVDTAGGGASFNSLCAGNLAGPVSRALSTLLLACDRRADP